MKTRGETRGEEVEYAFRPWVRRVCSKAMIWGMVVLVPLIAVVWALRDPNEGFAGKAFTVLLTYALLFWATLFKIWWTAGRPAVTLDETGVGYQPLHTFAPRRIAYDRILACGRRDETESQRFVVEGRGKKAKEFFLNLAVVRGKHDLLAQLGERLIARGLEPEGEGWRRPSFEDVAIGPPQV